MNARLNAVEDDRPVFVVKLRPEPGIDAVKGLRWILKVSLRQFGLRCLDIRREETSDGRADAKP
jgi:hypothetical protein